MKKYSKFIAMIVGTLLSAIMAALIGDSIISPVEWVNIAILGVGALMVFTAPNIPGAKYTKSVIAVLLAVLTVLSTVILTGVGTVELIQMAIAGLSALGVYQVDNSGAPIINTSS